jgi:hypothetical protein
MTDPIAVDSLKWMRSERTGKNEGGRMSGLEIVWGESNGLFPDVDEIAFAAGRVWLQKAFGFVDVLSDAVLFGAYVCITQPPANENVSATVFPAGYFDFVQDHRAYLSSYLANGPRLRAWPLETQLKNTQSIQIWARPELPLPELNRTYVLIGDEGQPTQYEQAVVFTDMSHSVQTFEENERTYQRRIITLTLAEPLRYTFYGPEVTRLDPFAPNATIRETVVAGAARLYGVATLTQEAAAGDYVLQVDRIDAQVVPASVHETNHAALTAAVRNDTLTPAAGGYVELETGLTFGPGVTLDLGSPAWPGSVSLQSGALTLQEVNGQLLSGTTVVATIDSGAGRITATPTAPTLTGLKTLRFRPAGVATAPMHCVAIKITEASRGTAFTLPLKPSPVRNTVSIAYLAGDKWYELWGQADGTVAGADEAHGDAYLNSLDSLAMRLGYTPDVGSYVLITFGTAVMTKDRSADALGKAGFLIQTAQPFGPGGLAVAWGDKTAQDDGEGGITGDATGEVLGPQSFILRPNVLPPKGTQLTVTITPRATATETFAGSDVLDGTDLAIDLAHGSVVPRSVRVSISGEITALPPAYYPVPVTPIMGGSG